ncbi:MAG: cytochrome bc complex cytochrome b subunit [Pleurocapsa minor GSE-CHR-MK-17-07R]|jgi:quinol-cytochrome oxidoreductase complex cytochrome b subunit|nr:cytochrome bc complex cytochrome b subunit [Pleurocapsa minor GSE-CHR-MK 17-07R]
MSVLPFPSFLDDVKEKGLKRAALEGINEVVERATAGMNLQDIREALRGEAASRKPNPRLQPHADGFWLHMRPSYFHKSVTGVYPEFRLGWLSTYFVFFETLTGIFLMIWYTPSPDVAYANMINIMSNVPFGQFVRDLHRLGAEAMVLIVFLHMLRTFFTGSYKKPRQFTWFSGVILLICTMFLSFSGYLLPWDQLALWAVTIGASMIEAAPPEVVGTNLNLLIRGGPDIGANGLLRFYLLHVLAVPAVLFIFTGVHYYKVIVHGHSLPPGEENIGEDTAKRVPLDKRVYFIPDILTSEIMWIAVTTLVLVVLSTWFFHAPLEAHADNQVTPLGTTAPWYFLWIQGALKLGDKVLWGIIFPTIVVVFLLVMPYLDVTKSRRYAHRRFAFTVAFLMLSVMVVFSYMGLPEFGVKTSADSEILYHMLMEPAHNHMGVLRPIPYDELVPGVYTTEQLHTEDYDGDIGTALASFNTELEESGLHSRLDQFLAVTQHLELNNLTFTAVPADAPELLEGLEKLEHELELYPTELPGAWAAIIVTEPQAGLKRVDVVISWLDVQIENGRPVMDANGELLFNLDENGEIARRVTGQYMYIHEDSQYFAAPGV